MPPDFTREELRQLALRHGLSSAEYDQVCQLLGREPNLVEVGIFSVMWSEHCSYKSSRAYLKQLPLTGKSVIYGPGENAGVVAINETQAVAFKMESHNHPSYLEPFQGAATGVGGIIRDIFTMGARPIALLDSLWFGPLQEPHNKYLLSRVVGGIAWYGNCIGIPTVGGELHTEECYRDNCLVNVFCLGLVERERIFTARASGLGNPVIYVGSATGRDGIHGATMASQEFGPEAQQLRPAVQVGDPFTEKLVMEACLELMRTDVLVAIQDMGAAGLTCSTVEMAARGGTGIQLDLSQVPVRERGITPYELMLSESQERMLLVARAGCEEEIKKTFEKWGLPAVVVGKVTPGEELVITSGPKEVARLPIPPLTTGAPIYERRARQPEFQKEVQELDLAGLKEPGDYNQVLLELLASPAIASKGWIYRQYDHEVGINTVVKPGADAALLRIKGTSQGIGLTVDGNGRYCYLDPCAGSALVVCEAARNLACLGARPLGLTDCLNFGNPEKPEVMWQFIQTVEGIRQACLALNTPVVSGNVSFYNETKGQGIYPTPTVAMVGLMEDRRCHRTPWFKEPGHLIVLLGDGEPELGGSEYLKVIHQLVRGRPPRLDLAREVAVIAACLEAISSGIVESAHDCSQGGLAVALAECCLGDDTSGLGATVLLKEAGRTDALLFGEASAKILFSLREEMLPALAKIAERNHVPYQVVGRVGGSRLKVNAWLDLELTTLREAWQAALEKRLAISTQERVS